MKLLNKIIRKTFFIWEKFGFFVIPNHFYEPIPDIKKLRNKKWSNYSELIGIDMRDQNQKNLLNLFFNKFKKEYDLISMEKGNSEFGPVDAEILYCMVRELKPKKIIEIGSGYSTNIIIEAILKNKKEFGVACDLKSVDPFAKDFIKNKKFDFFELIKKEIQDISLEFFNNLEENDILFIDSSHVLKTGSDVQYEYLEILPRINNGVIVHSHDIFLPLEYPKDWILKEYRFFNEQYLLQAFLAFNKEFEILWSSSYMNFKHKNVLFERFKSFDKKNSAPSSFWIKRKK
jgi:predicted O-methyltransferase YrrM